MARPSAGVSGDHVEEARGDVARAGVEIGALEDIIWEIGKWLHEFCSRSNIPW
jgi:hypothetical protein